MHQEKTETMLSLLQAIQDSGTSVADTFRKLDDMTLSDFVRFLEDRDIVFKCERTKKCNTLLDPEPADYTKMGLEMLGVAADDNNGLAIDELQRRAKEAGLSHINIDAYDTWGEVAKRLVHEQNTKKPLPIKALYVIVTKKAKGSRYLHVDGRSWVKDRNQAARYSNDVIGERLSHAKQPFGWTKPKALQVPN